MHKVFYSWHTTTPIPDILSFIHVCWAWDGLKGAKFEHWKISWNSDSMLHSEGSCFLCKPEEKSHRGCLGRSRWTHSCKKRKPPSPWGSTVQQPLPLPSKELDGKRMWDIFFFHFFFSDLSWKFLMMGHYLGHQTNSRLITQLNTLPFEGTAGP